MGFIRKLIRKGAGDVVREVDEVMDENVREFLALAKTAAAEVADSHELVIRVSLERKTT